MPSTMTPPSPSKHAGGGGRGRGGGRGPSGRDGPHRHYGGRGRGGRGGRAGGHGRGGRGRGRGRTSMARGNEKAAYDGGIASDNVAKEDPRDKLLVGEMDEVAKTALLKKQLGIGIGGADDFSADLKISDCKKQGNPPRPKPKKKKNTKLPKQQGNQNNDANGNDDSEPNISTNAKILKSEHTPISARAKAAAARARARAAGSSERQIENQKKHSSSARPKSKQKKHDKSSVQHGTQIYLQDQVVDSPMEATNFAASILPSTEVDTAKTAKKNAKNQRRIKRINKKHYEKSAELVNDIKQKSVQHADETNQQEHRVGTPPESTTAVPPSLPAGDVDIAAAGSKQKNKKQRRNKKSLKHHTFENEDDNADDSHQPNHHFGIMSPAEPTTFPSPSVSSMDTMDTNVNRSNQSQKKLAKKSIQQLKQRRKKNKAETFSEPTIPSMSNQDNMGTVRPNSKQSDKSLKPAAKQPKQNIASTNYVQREKENKIEKPPAESATFDSPSGCIKDNTTNYLKPNQKKVSESIQHVKEAQAEKDTHKSLDVATQLLSKGLHMDTACTNPKQNNIYLKTMQQEKENVRDYPNKSAQDTHALESLSKLNKDSSDSDLVNPVQQMIPSDTLETSTSLPSHQDLGAPVDANADEAPVSQGSEKERTARLLREAREKSAAAKEKNKSKKSKKHDKWLKEQEEEKATRAKSWNEKVAKENKTIDFISRLIVAEFLRQNKGMTPTITKEQVFDGPTASEAIVDESKRAYAALFEGLKYRVNVAGSERKDLNGRQGTLRHWDADKEKFCVGLDTKKSADRDVYYVLPENLEALSAPRGSSKADKKSVELYSVEIDEISNYGGEGIGCRFILERCAVLELQSAESVENGLKAFCLGRNIIESRLEKEAEEGRRQEEETAQQEELDRKFRADFKTKQRAEKERVKEASRKETEATHMEYQRLLEEQRRAEARTRAGSMPHEMLLRMYLKFRHANLVGSMGEFLEMMDNMPGMGGAEFMFGGFDFGDGDSDDDDDVSGFFDDGNEEYEQEFRAKREAEHGKHAEILGVEPNADERTLKISYRKLALEYHPDKWRGDSDHGMTREEAENHFKSIQNSYDHLMARFDDDEDSE